MDTKLKHFYKVSLTSNGVKLSALLHWEHLIISPVRVCARVLRMFYATSLWGMTSWSIFSRMIFGCILVCVSFLYIPTCQYFNGGVYGKITTYCYVAKYCSYFNINSLGWNWMKLQIFLAFLGLWTLKMWLISLYNFSFVSSKYLSVGRKWTIVPKVEYKNVIRLFHICISQTS